jgi:hypothetical protein
LILAPPRLVGLYHSEDRQLRPPWNTLAVSLLDATESDLRQAGDLSFGSQPIATIDPAKTKIRQPVHTWFLWVALAILLGEWCVYLRRSRM